jgi:hypothetical protein
MANEPSREDATDRGCGLLSHGHSALRKSASESKDRWMKAEIEGQCLAINDDPHEMEESTFIEQAMDYSGWV